jgi:hypothetical protein
MSPEVYDIFKDFAAPIASIIAASAAAFVAYRLGKSQADSARLQAEIAKRNWQTANERVVLDLFERRIALYEGIRHVVAKVINRTAGQQGVQRILRSNRPSAILFWPRGYGLS